MKKYLNWNYLWPVRKKGILSLIYCCDRIILFTHIMYFRKVYESAELKFCTKNYLQYFRSYNIGSTWVWRHLLLLLAKHCSYSWYFVRLVCGHRFICVLAGPKNEHSDNEKKGMRAVDESFNVPESLLTRKNTDFLAFILFIFIYFIFWTGCKAGVNPDCRDNL